MANGDYPIRVSTRSGQRVFQRVRCDLCGGTKLKCLSSREAESDAPGGIRVRSYECKECINLHSRQPHRFKITLI